MIFLLVKPKNEGEKLSASGVSPKWVESIRREKKRERKEKVCENNGHLCFHVPPQVENASRLDQKHQKGNHTSQLKLISMDCPTKNTKNTYKE